MGEAEGLALAHKQSRHGGYNKKAPFKKNKIPYALDYLAMDGEQKVIA